MGDVTRILADIERGDPSAAEQLLPLVYEELRRLAAQKMAGEAPDQTLQPTALVHEAYLRLAGAGSPPSYRDRGHFFTLAANAMRRILIDNARRRQSEKHGSGRQRVEFEDLVGPVVDDDLLALDEALRTLATQHPLKARLVELRYFAGLTGDQAAEVLGVSPSTADRDWIFARAWLQAELRAK
ncbi:MAG: sigma-70 family RNA polymerase sigma factor [Planctomycetaceae bacterium]|nr:sigma-70 family RNA polymerase sigma factor [Planctomycetaceae bacterium]